MDHLSFKIIFLGQSKLLIVIISEKKLAKNKKYLYYYLQSDFFFAIRLKVRAFKVFITLNK